MNLNILYPDAQFSGEPDLEREGLRDRSEPAYLSRRLRQRDSAGSLARLRCRCLLRYRHRAGHDRSFSPLPSDRARRRRLRSNRHRSGRRARHPCLQHAGLWHDGCGRSCDRHDACPDPRHRRLQRPAEARSCRGLGLPSRADGQASCRPDVWRARPWPYRHRGRAPRQGVRDGRGLLRSCTVHRARNWLSDCGAWTGSKTFCARLTFSASTRP